MKNTQECPKCQSRDIIKIPNAPYNYIIVKRLGYVKVTRYLCTTCGYLEDYVENKKDIERIVQKYKK